uniref:hypothetical protein n=1 Tax=Bidens bipinnata TaxID=1527831 RepID=UPI001EDFD711|nr:hypothetical protein MFQ52_mgp60 [Bidens bipinnata]YP_010352685.1 hypothetical protein MFU86_mgp60 [Bidens biternata]UIR99039.1 hypothetical protein [Bidens bipinnata]UIR99102.1 hypothetical protein [Bidens biternata]UIR99164.1 hypothetical protein [Bidens biternata]UIR99283.1 hypothetical protein [Bidens bipinnata]
MIDDILSGDYQLSPILVCHIEEDEDEDEYESFCHQKTVLSSSFCGLLRFYPKKKAGYLTLSRPSTEKDVLLIAALEQVLLESTEECSSIEDLVYDYHSDIKKEMLHVNRIFRIEIDYPPDIGPFLKRISSINLQYDTHIYQYIISFQNLSYIDEYGLCHESMNGTYTVGDLSRIVLNLVLKEIFDYEFRKVFPGIAFLRFVNQVIIGTKDSDEVLFNEEEGYALLKSLGLTGQILSRGIGESPLPISGNKLLKIRPIG